MCVFYGYSLRDFLTLHQFFIYHMQISRFFLHKSSRVYIYLILFVSLFRTFDFVYIL